jgi:hypothetical protein
MATVTSDREFAANFDRPLRRIGVDTDNRVARPDQIGCIRVHHDLERGKSLAALAQEIEKIPLRHEGDEGVFDVQPAEIRDANCGRPKLALHLLQLLMRKLQEAVDQAQLVHHLQRRGMHGIATKIPEEICVLLQHQRLDTRPSEQIP